MQKIAWVGTISGLVTSMRGAMFKILTFNQIAAKGLDLLPKNHYEVAADLTDPHGIILRSHKLSAELATARLCAVARAGVGYNNIPVEAYTKKGIVVFNTPSANTNSVKELVLASLLNASRGIVSGNTFVHSLVDIKDAASLHKIVEQEKKRFKGQEIAGKTLGIAGLGSIGGQVARAALDLNMKVLGHDPALSIEAAWRISSTVERIDRFENMLSRSDYISLHVPLMASTKHLINADSLKACKQGATLLNFSRDAIVDAKAVGAALDTGRLASYFADFPEPELLGRDNAFLTPHLGASTVEAEENCAIMAVQQLRDFLENGNIRNSVNFPAASLERIDTARFAVTNKNIPAMLGQILSVLAKHSINVLDMLNKSRDDIAYNLIDVECQITEGQVQEIFDIEGVVGVRCF